MGQGNKYIDNRKWQIFFLEHLDAGQSSRNVSVLSDMTSKIWADFAKD
jgi:hypothetical protein